jgi:hypothetical protein
MLSLHLTLSAPDLTPRLVTSPLLSRILHQPMLSMPMPIPPTVSPSETTPGVRRSTRLHRPASFAPVPSRPTPSSRVPVNQRWYYDPVRLRAAKVAHNLTPRASLGGETSHALVFGPPPLDASLEASSGTDTASILRQCDHIRSTTPSLLPRASWMLDGDSRIETHADHDWHQSNRLLFASRSSLPDCFPTMDLPIPPPPVTTALLSDLRHTTSSTPLDRFDADLAFIPAPPPPDFPRLQPTHLSSKVVRRPLVAKESIFKYGIFLPRNDRDADSSPERARWYSGRQLEWIRLKDVGAFEYDWDKERLSREYPAYLHSDIGHLFYIYDYKFSGEHRVRLVFDGSRQSSNTYDDTFSPTVRPESIRLFHVYSVEMGWDIRQYDVPQAFLQAPVDHIIFVYPPRTNVEFPGQILKLRLALYGAKQSSALFFKLLNGFLLSLGFVSFTLDPCFYKRMDALIIVHVDDMRCSGTPEALLSIHDALFQRFKITTGDGSRFLGMDSHYNLDSGVLSLGMNTYIQTTMDRFVNFDTTLGCHYREIVGCLLWIVLCVLGPDLVRVKDLAKRSNNSTATDYADAVKVLKRIYKRRSAVILFKRGYAGRELIPSTLRPLAAIPAPAPVVDPAPSATAALLSTVDLVDQDYDIDTIDDDEPLLPTTTRFTTVAYTDASFAVGSTKDSYSGYVIFVNCTPIMWGSARQKVVADSTCAAEFVAASACCKQLTHVENMFRFFGFICKKPYPVYTDSQAALAIAMNAQRMGKIRHISIRYHLVRCMVISGDVLLIFCVTEDMIADLLTKILTGTIYDRLSARFYFLGM